MLEESDWPYYGGFEIKIIDFLTPEQKENAIRHQEELDASLEVIMELNREFKNGSSI